MSYNENPELALGSQFGWCKESSYDGQASEGIDIVQPVLSSKAPKRELLD